MIKITSVIGSIDTDVSGKWVNVEDIDIIADRIIAECINVVDDFEISRKILDHFNIDQLITITFADPSIHRVDLLSNE